MRRGDPDSLAVGRRSEHRSRDGANRALIGQSESGLFRHWASISKATPRLLPAWLASSDLNAASRPPAPAAVIDDDRLGIGFSSLSLSSSCSPPLSHSVRPSVRPSVWLPSVCLPATT